MTTLNEIFEPQSIAVIGASKDPYKAGHQVLKLLLNEGYNGKVYAIHPVEQEVLGLECHKSILDINEPLDMLVIGVPANHVLPIMEQARQRGDIKGVVVLSAGFSETAIPELVAIERQLVDIARSAGMRVFGPNCLGIANPEIKVCTGFAPGVKLIPGNIGIVSQSGAFGGAILMLLAEQPEPLGFAKFGHIGNMSDVSNIDLIEAYGDDPKIKVIAVYMEGVRNGREFLKVAARVSQKKPILLLKVGRTEIGSKAALSHTGTLAGSDSVYSGAFRQSGIIRVDTLEELVDSAKAISMLKRPTGNKLCILTEAGGPGIICMDEVEKGGVLQLAPLTTDTEHKLTELLPSMAMICKPNGYVDMTAAALAREHAESLRLILSDPNVDSAIVISVPPTFLPAIEVAQALVPVIKEFDKPVAICFMKGQPMIEARKYLEKNGIATFDTPDRAAKALAALTRTQYSSIYELADQVACVCHPVIEDAKSHSRNLVEPEALQLLRDNDITALPFKLAHSKEEAQQAAADFGGAVVLKIVSPEVIHKSDVGAVKVNLRGWNEVGAAYDEIIDNVKQAVPNANIGGILVVPMAKPGTEVIVGMVRDAQFGPVIMFGMGGVFVEVFKDVSFRVAAFGHTVARQMIEETTAYKILAGTRGEKPKDIDSLANLMVKVSELATKYPEISEIDLNPVRVYEQGISVLDARIMLK